MCEEEPVYESSATCYEEASKKWKSGLFRLYENYILFSYDEDKVITIPLKNVSSLEKRQSSLIYAALVISIQAEKYWFASFPNRDSLYNLIELFWRDTLLSKNHIPSPEKPKSASSDLGKELLGILHESEVTLINAANALSDQGKQIEDTQATIADINSDLNIAERFIGKMSSFSSLFQKANASSIANVADEAQADLLKSFKVSYLLSDAVTDDSFWDRGTLLIDKEKITVSNDKKIQLLTLYRNNVISCQTITSWKLRLDYKENNEEKSLYIMCPQLSKLLKYLNTFTMKHTNDINSPTTSFSSSFSSPSMSSSINAGAKEIDEQGSESRSEQLQDDLMSDADIEEISNVLNSLQSLAAEVSKEQQDQMEKINALMSSAETTELRMKVDTNKIKKLI